MHGRLKVRTTEEQKLIKEKEHQKKLLAYRMGMNKIRSTRRKDSYDEESLGIAAKILSSNPDIYTLWNYRKEVILMKITEWEGAKEEKHDQLVNFLEDELKLTELCLLSNPKSYGTWHHRYWVLEHHIKPNWNTEFRLCNKYSAMDDRNFHCWDYRRQIVNKIGISLKDELEFSTKALNNNFSNYSSWHYRSTLRNLDQSSLDNELNLVQSAVFTDPFDSSAWFYFRWVLSHDNISQEKRQAILESLKELHELEPDCKWILLGKCWLTGSSSLSDKNQIENQIDCYNELIKLDPLRRGQYEDYLKHSKKSNDS